VDYEAAHAALDVHGTLQVPRTRGRDPALANIAALVASVAFGTFDNSQDTTPGALIKTQRKIGVSLASENFKELLPVKLFSLCSQHQHKEAVSISASSEPDSSGRCLVPRPRLSLSCSYDSWDRIADRCMASMYVGR